MYLAQGFARVFRSGRLRGLGCSAGQRGWTSAGWRAGNEGVKSYHLALVIGLPRPRLLPKARKQPQLSVRNPSLRSRLPMSLRPPCGGALAKQSQRSGSADSPWPPRKSGRFRECLDGLPFGGRPPVRSGVPPETFFETGPATLAQIEHWKTGYEQRTSPSGATSHSNESFSCVREAGATCPHLQHLQGEDTVDGATSTG